MSNGYKINTNISNKQRKFESEKYETIRDIIDINILQEHKIKRTPTLGPRAIFYHYIYDLNWPIKNAINEIIKQFPSLNEEIILKWFKQDREKKEGKSKNNDNNER